MSSRKIDFIADEVSWKNKALKSSKILKPCSLTLPSKPEDRKGDKIFCMSLALITSHFRTVYDTTPAFVISNTGKVMIPMRLVDVENDSKDLLKEDVCKVIDSLFEFAKI